MDQRTRSRIVGADAIRALATLWVFAGHLFLLEPTLKSLASPALRVLIGRPALNWMRAREKSRTPATTNPAKANRTLDDKTAARHTPDKTRPTPVTPSESTPHIAHDTIHQPK